MSYLDVILILEVILYNTNIANSLLRERIARHVFKFLHSLNLAAIF